MSAFSISEMHGDVLLWSTIDCPACVILTLNIAVHMGTWIHFSFLLPESSMLLPSICAIWIMV